MIVTAKYLYLIVSIISAGYWLRLENTYDSGSSFFSP